MLIGVNEYTYANSYVRREDKEDIVVRDYKKIRVRYINTDKILFIKEIDFDTYIEDGEIGKVDMYEIELGVDYDPVMTDIESFLKIKNAMNN